MPDFNKIERFPAANYKVDVPLVMIEDQLASWSGKSGKLCLDLSPDYQRGHVWSEAQQAAYVEYILRGGESSRILTFNCANWMGRSSSSSASQMIELVDGKQRLEAIRRFMRNDLPVLGCVLSGWSGSIRIHEGITFRMMNLTTREQVLKFYIMHNSGGTPHSPEELDRVRELLRKERESKV